jgi:hypothetical protein
MGLPLTLGLTAAVIALGAFCGWRGARPPDPHRGPRLMPWRFVMVLCGAVTIYLAAHLLSLLGLMPAS